MVIFGFNYRRRMLFNASLNALSTGAPQSHLVGHFSSASTSSLSGLGLNSGGCGSGSETTSTTTNLIVNSLPQDMTERELYSLFVTMGPIESCRVMRDLKTGYSYGFGFVNFISDESALRAIKCLNGLTIRNKRIKVGGRVIIKLMAEGGGRN